MGLRETKAARTRAQIVAVAIALFADRGYEATTMEEIAERAEVGTTTLYRYFPSKDLILLDPFTKVDAVAGALRGRPAGEPIELALGAAIRQSLEAVTAEQPHLDTVRTIIDGAPGPRARLWDFIAQDRDLLEKAIAARVGGGLSDLRIKMTARLTLLVIDLAADTWRSGDHRRSMTDIADGILDEIGGEGIVVPRRSPSR